MPLAETEAVQMLQRFTQVGEYYLMQPPASLVPGDDAKNYMGKPRLYTMSLASSAPCT